MLPEGRNNCAKCGAELLFRFSGTPTRPVWKLLMRDPETGETIPLPDKCCPQCKQSFAAMTAEEVVDAFWPGGMAH